MATPSRPTSGMGSVASSSPRTTKIATVDAEKVAMQKEMAAMRAEMAAMKQQANAANKVMDDHENALLNAQKNYCLCLSALSLKLKCA